MPYVRITLRGGRPPEQLKTISECLHAAMVEAFDVPANDRFHFFQTHEPDEISVDPHYLSSGRTADFMHFEIVVGRPRSAAAKAAFYARLATGLGAALGIARGDVMVVILATSPDDWSFGDGLTAAQSMAGPSIASLSA